MNWHDGGKIGSLYGVLVIVVTGSDTMVIVIEFRERSEKRIAPLGLSIGWKVSCLGRPLCSVWVGMAR